MFEFASQFSCPWSFQVWISSWLCKENLVLCPKSESLSYRHYYAEQIQWQWSHVGTLVGRCWKSLLTAWHIHYQLCLSHQVPSQHPEGHKPDSSNLSLVHTVGASHRLTGSRNGPTWECWRLPVYRPPHPLCLQWLWARGPWGLCKSILSLVLSIVFSLWPPHLIYSMPSKYVENFTKNSKLDIGWWLFLWTLFTKHILQLMLNTCILL